MTQAEPPPGLMAAWGLRGAVPVADTPRACLWRVKQGDVVAVHAALAMCWHREAGTPVAFDKALLPRLLAACDAAL